MAQILLTPPPKLQFFDDAGKPLAGGLLYVAQPGTSCGPGSPTLITTYTDASGGTANTNPIVLDAAGRCNLWISGYCKMALYTAAGALLWTQDNVSAGNQASTTAGYLTKSVAGSSNVTLTAAESSNLFHDLTGVLTGNIAYIVQPTPAQLYVYNETSGAYTVTVRTPAGTGIVVPQGTRAILECDGINVVNPVQASATELAEAFGQCRLTKSGANLLLSPFNGNLLTIAGTIYAIPDAGVTLAAPTPGAETTYYIYAYMNTGTMTLEASATAPAVDTTAGNKGVVIKTADNSRTLVGMARVLASNAWSDTAAKRYVISYFNRRNIQAGVVISGNVNTTSATYVEISTNLRTEFLCWSDEAVTGAISGPASSTGGVFFVGGSYDGTTLENGAVAHTVITAGNYMPIAQTTMKSLADGYHYFTVVTKSSGGATLTLYGSATASDSFCTNILLRG